MQLSSLYQINTIIITVLTYTHLSVGKIIDCIETKQCFNQTIICPSNEDCIIHCSNDSSCSYSSIICPLSFNCNISCKYPYSCNNILIPAQHSLSLTINTNGYNSLSFSKIYCPTNQIVNSCNIIYFDNENGSNNMNIYSINNYNTINIQCPNSTSICWSKNNNPIINYGDYTYSQTCTMQDINTCNYNTNGNILIANDINANSIDANVISTTIPLTTSIINVSTVNNSYLLKHIVIFICIGIFIGILISICCTILICFIYHNKSNRNTLHISPKTKPNKMRLSPSLKQLSPRLASSGSIDELPPQHILKIQKEKTNTSLRVEVGNMDLTEYTDYVDFVNEGLSIDCEYAMNDEVVIGDDELDVNGNVTSR
eukprot:183833_1